MAIADINLLDHEPAIRQVETGGGADGITPSKILRRMAGKDSDVSCCVTVCGQQQIELQEVVQRHRLIVVEERVFPLVGSSKVQQAISIHVGSRNAARYLGIVQP